jgi:hypothetical protein
MLAGRRRKVWTFMAGLHLLQQRHRATTILISRPSCAARQPEDCYNSDDGKGPGCISRDLCFFPAAAREMPTKRLILNDELCIS